MSRLSHKTLCSAGKAVALSKDYTQEPVLKCFANSGMLARRFYVKESPNRSKSVRCENSNCVNEVCSFFQVRLNFFEIIFLFVFITPGSVWKHHVGSRSCCYDQRGNV